MPTTHQPLGELVTAIPAAAKVFHRYGLDFCCHGKQSLAEACASRGLDASSILREAEDARGGAGSDVRWAERTLPDLVQHILDRYHAPLREELARLTELARKVERVHADKPAVPAGLARVLGGMASAIDDHLGKEEQILFPLIIGGDGRTARMPIRVMMQEHEEHGENLRRIRELTSDFGVPEYACMSWRELYRALTQLELDLMEHIHLENDILFPRALDS